MNLQAAIRRFSLLGKSETVFSLSQEKEKRRFQETLPSPATGASFAFLSPLASKMAETITSTAESACDTGTRAPKSVALKR